MSEVPRAILYVLGILYDLGSKRYSLCLRYQELFFMSEVPRAILYVLGSMNSKIGAELTSRALTLALE